MNSTLESVGEKKVVDTILRTLSVNKNLLGGFGHDSAFINVSISNEEVLLVNTDRSGMNIAYKLGLADAECIGDFAVSHAISDILASGGEPFAISIALLLPSNMEVDEVKKVMLGAQKAANKYGAFIASGDTKKSEKFAMVVTALGKAKKSQLLPRNNAQIGDYIVVAGNLGMMISGLLAIKKKISITKDERDLFEQALIFQNPPYELSRIVANSEIAHACMDNSDGLSGTIHAICSESNLGAEIDMEKFNITAPVKKIAKFLDVDPFQLCLGSGDWQHVFTIPSQNVKKIQKISEQTKVPISVVGRITKDPRIIIKTNNERFLFPCIQNDRFGIGGTSWFDFLSRKIDYLGEKVW